MARSQRKKPRNGRGPKVQRRADDESSNESEGADDDAAAEDGSNNGGEGDVRPRVETRGARKQAEREKRLPKSMPSASVCIAFEASLWPKDDREFTDGVQEVFLDGCEEEDLQEHEDRDALVRADVT